MSRSIRSRVFEPFFTTKANGLVMGLTISRAIVEAHDDRLSAKRNANGAMTFSFVLPAVIASGAQPECQRLGCGS